MRPKRVTTQSPIAESSVAETRTEGSHQRMVGRRVAVTDRIVKKIIARAEASQLGLSPAETSLEIGQYAQHNLETLALLLVSGWHGKYDLVSVFAAAMQVIEEEASNGKLTRPENNQQTSK